MSWRSMNPSMGLDRCTFSESSSGIDAEWPPFSQGQFSSVLWSNVLGVRHRMLNVDVLVFTRARLFQHSFRIKHRMFCVDATSLWSLSSDWVLLLQLFISDFRDTLPSSPLLNQHDAHANWNYVLWPWDHNFFQKFDWCTHGSSKALSASADTICLAQGAPIILMCRTLRKSCSALSKAVVRYVPVPIHQCLVFKI